MNFQLLTFIGGIALLIILHEFGHFLAAKLLKVDVEEFGIGFPPRILKLFTAGGTEFTLNWIPLGGFVRIKGENDPDVPGGLAAANPWIRFAVISAGPITNILIGIILSVL
ncbi:MAG: site-2 protease family protein, partial [Anaerolineales bacterium]